MKLVEPRIHGKCLLKQGVIEVLISRS